MRERNSVTPGTDFSGRIFIISYDPVGEGRSDPRDPSRVKGMTEVSLRRVKEEVRGRTKDCHLRTPTLLGKVVHHKISSLCTTKGAEERNISLLNLFQTFPF